MQNWNTDKIYKQSLFLCRKNNAGGISADNFFNAWNMEQNMYHTDIVGRWQNKNVSKEQGNTGLILNETILTDLAPFTIPVTLPVTSGKATKPDDFIFRISARISGKKVIFINQGQITSVTASVIDPPSITDGVYYGVQYEDYYSILPNTVTSMDLDYVAAPNDIKWAYTFGPDGEQVYNPGASIQPKWSDPTCLTITKRALTSFGISFKDNDFTQAGRFAQASGD